MRRVAALVVFLSAVSLAQVNTNLDASASGWQMCSACAGGVNVATNMTVTETSSAKNGHGLKLHLSGPGYANGLYYRPLGQTSADYFYYDVWIYISSANLAAAEALEYDFYAYNAPYRFLWGSECVMGGDWYGWNDNVKTWIDLKMPCSIVAGWSHIQWWGHRDPITTANCSGMPCSYQDTLGVNSVYSTINLVTPASWLPSGWTNDSGAQVQLDQNASGTDVNAVISDLNFAELGQ